MYNNQQKLTELLDKNFIKLKFNKNPLKLEQVRDNCLFVIGEAKRQGYDEIHTRALTQLTEAYMYQGDFLKAYVTKQHLADLGHITDRSDLHEMNESLFKFMDFKSVDIYKRLIKAFYFELDELKLIVDNPDIYSNKSKKYLEKSAKHNGKNKLCASASARPFNVGVEIRAERECRNEKDKYALRSKLQEAKEKLRLIKFDADNRLRLSIQLALCELINQYLPELRHLEGESTRMIARRLLVSFDNADLPNRYGPEEQADLDEQFSTAYKP